MIWTTFITVLSAVLVFIISQLIVDNFQKPIQEWKELKAEIAFNLIFYADCYSNPLFIDPFKTDNSRGNYVSYEFYRTSKHKEASDVFRKLSAKTRAFAETKKWLPWWMINKKKLIEVSSEFIGLSNSMYSLKDSETIHDNLVLNRGYSLTIADLCKLKDSIK